MQKGIRIRERYLTALEEERWDMLPGDAYTKGFLRTYAEFLGLDGQLYIDEYNSRIAQREEEPLVPESMAPRGTRSGVLFTLVGILVLGAAVAGLAAWRLGGSSTPAQAHAPSVHVSAAAADQPIAAAAPAPSSAKPKPAAPLGPAVAVISAVRGRCWLWVRAGGPSGAELYRGVLEQGKVERFDVSKPVWVRFGNPAAVDVRIAGRAVSGLPTSPANLLLSRSGSHPA